MRTTAQVIQELIETDTDYKEASLQARVKEVQKPEHSDDSTLFLNEFLIALCGYSWETVQELRKK